MTEVIQTFKGTHDISGDEMRFRNYVTKTIQEVLELFGFEPLETPVLERKETLTGKYGSEAENLLFMLAEPYDYGGLRYDHTVPLARFVASNWNTLSKPYKRFAIGPVFRGESPQSGRYRQFTQCDFDTIGSNSAVVDAEIVAINDMVLRRLGFKDEYKINFNDRKFLNAIIKEIGFENQEAVSAVLRAWDKLDKISVEDTLKYLEKELEQIGGVDENLKQKYLDLTNSLKEISETNNLESFSKFKNLFSSQEIAQVEELYKLILSLGVADSRIQFNPLLARGLSYYTGPIFETIVTKGGVGSISGGGRYDNLIEALGGPDLPASGSSFGLDRMMVVMEELGLRPESSQTTKVFISIFDRDNSELTLKSYEMATKLREEGIQTDIYIGESNDLGKQIKTAVDRKIPVLLLIGPDEFNENKVTVKDLNNRIEEKVDYINLLESIRKIIE